MSTTSGFIIGTVTGTQLVEVYLDKEQVLNRAKCAVMVFSQKNAVILPVPNSMISVRTFPESLSLR